MTRRSIRFLLPAAAAVLTFSACGPKKTVKQDDDAAQQWDKNKVKKEPNPIYTPPTDVTEASLRGTDFAGVDGLEAIHFDYDSANLKDEALASLKKNAEYMKEHKDDQYRIAGYCDDRGTIEYNLALGQKRAKQVREYYIRLGVPGAAVATISYGKENPVCSEATEDCWAQNRRAETSARSRTASSLQPGVITPQPQ